MKKISVLIFILLILSILPQPVDAYYSQRVLGESDKPLIMPPTAEGPGFILPDSPFYFLDQLKQSVRILFSRTPETRARVYASIAGERFAELRFMLAKNDLSAAEVALFGVRSNTRNAAIELSQAQFAGKDVKDLAKDINQSIKSHLLAIDSVTGKANGETKAALAWTDLTLSDAKYMVENSLDPADLSNEVKDDLVRETIHLADSTAGEAVQLKQDIEILQNQEKDAAKNKLQKRQTALETALALKNTQLQKIESQYLSEEMSKSSQAQALQTHASAQAQSVAVQAQTIASDIKTALQVNNAPASSVILGIMNTPAPTIHPLQISR